MWRSWAFASLATVAACQAAPPKDCTVAHKQAQECMGRFHSGQDRQMLLGCFPFSKPEKIEGAWYYGFELNSFSEGARATPRDVAPPVGGDVSLEYDPHLPIDGRVRVLQMQIVGRRSQCPMGLPDHIIVVDRVISSTVKAVSN
jgi:hypothetical protein